MAVHGALVGGRTGAPAAGYLVGLRSVMLHVARLDDIETDLWSSGERIHSDDTSVLYQFSVHIRASTFLSGRATVLLDAAALRVRTAPAMTTIARRALVTGGSGEIGAAICRRLALRRALCVRAGASRYRRRARSGGRDHAAGGRAQALGFDVTDAARTHAALEAVLADGPIQILVNNAGIHDDAVFPAMSAQQWHASSMCRVDGFFNVTQPLMLPMIRTRWGRIVSISSVAALMGNRGQVNYAAAKGALNSATRALALEVATRGITVNAVAPGIIATGMTDNMFDDETIARLVPMKRAGLPEEVASLVAFLASEEAAYITAQVISINGGMT